MLATESSSSNLKPTKIEGGTLGQTGRSRRAKISIPLKDKQTKAGACSQWQSPRTSPLMRKELGLCRLIFQCLPTKPPKKHIINKFVYDSFKQVWNYSFTEHRPYLKQSLHCSWKTVLSHSWRRRCRTLSMKVKRFATRQQLTATLTPKTVRLSDQTCSEKPWKPKKMYLHTWAATFSSDFLLLVFPVLVWELSRKEGSKKNSEEEDSGGQGLFPLITAHQIILKHGHSYN